MIESMILVHASDSHIERSYKLQKFTSFFSGILRLNTLYVPYNNKKKDKLWFFMSALSQINCFVLILKIHIRSCPSPLRFKDRHIGVFLLVPGTALLTFLLSIFRIPVFIYHAGPSRKIFNSSNLSLRNILDFINYTFATKIIIPSPACISHFQLEVYAKKVRIGYFPLNNSFLDVKDEFIIKKNILVETNKITLCYVGNIGYGDNAIRRVDLLIDAIAYIRSSYPLPIELKVLGKRKTFHSNSFLNENKSYVQFLDWGDSRQVAAIIASSSFLVLPTVSEGLPTVAVEAGLLEIPILASKIGGIIDLIGADESRGFFINSLDDLHISILSAVTCSIDIKEEKVRKMKDHIQKMYSYNMIYKYWSNIL